MRTRGAAEGDAATIARIFNEGIEDRVATFDTEPRTADDILGWLEEGYPLVVAEEDGEVVAWAVAHPYSARAVYSGVGDFSIYVARARRGSGLGRVTLGALVRDCEARGYWKLLGRIFTQNEASLGLSRSLGFREVGVYRRHGRLDGEWRDCVIVERLLGEAAEARVSTSVAAGTSRSPTKENRVGENFPEGTSQSDPSAVPPLDTESLEDVPPRIRDEDRTLPEEPSIEEEPENQQTG